MTGDVRRGDFGQESKINTSSSHSLNFWARGYMAISSGNITDEMIQEYIDEQEGEPVDDHRFQIDSSL
jgi:REP element-mobilizing transposase RayT